MPQVFARSLKCTCDQSVPVYSIHLSLSLCNKQVDAMCLSITPLSHMYLLLLCIHIRFQNLPIYIQQRWSDEMKPICCRETKCQGSEIQSHKISQISQILQSTLYSILLMGSVGYKHASLCYSNSIYRYSSSAQAFIGIYLWMLFKVKNLSKSMRLLND